MILSFHLADVDRRTALQVLRQPPRRDSTPGLRYARTVLAAPLGPHLLPRPQLRRVGLIAAWDDDAALDVFSGGDGVAELLRTGWQVRLRPLRGSGAWPGLPELTGEHGQVADDEPVAVITLGRPKLGRLPAFLRTTARAEGQVISDPAVLATTGLARPPGLVATFSLWRTAACMRAYAYTQGAAHRAAIEAQRARPFHHESLFARFAPYASMGGWDGRDPLAAAVAERAPS